MASHIPPDTPATISLPPIPTPAHGSKGCFTVACSAQINATPLTCLNVVLDAASYPQWNRFCRSCVIEGTAAYPPSTPSSSSSTNTSNPTPSVNETLRTLPRDPRRHKAFLALGFKFVFDVHLDPETADSAGRDTALEISVLEQFDESKSDSPSSSEEGKADSSTRADKGKGRAVPGGEEAQPTSPPGDLRRGWRLAWKTRGMMPAWMLRSERVQEFVEVRIPFGGDEEAETNYVCWETFYGVLAPVVRTVVGLKLVRGFQVWMDDLRKRAEELERRSGHYASMSREAETRLKMVPEGEKLEL